MTMMTMEKDTLCMLYGRIPESINRSLVEERT